MLKISFKLLFISTGFFFISLFFRDRLPPQGQILEDLLYEPVQTETSVSEFQVDAGGYEYIITPVYDYEFYGMVVSYFNAGSWRDYTHSGWKDYINVKDIAAIWGNNLESGVYRHVKFWSGNWTWNAKARRDIWNRFDVSSISNSHILADDEEIKRLLLETRRGDQIYFRGFLADYRRAGTEFSRKSSISRDDRGGHSCEVVFVEEYEILKTANPIWRKIHKMSGYSAVILFIFIIVIFFGSATEGL